MNTPDRRDMLWSFSIPLFLFGGMSVFFAWHHRAEDDRWLAEQESVVASVAADRIDPAHDGYLVHAVGRLTYAPGGYTDPWSGQTHGGFALVRRAEVFTIPRSEDGTSPPPSWMSNGGQAVFGDTPEATDPTRTVVWLPPAVRLGAFTLDPRLVPRIVGNAIGIRPERYVGGNEFTPPEQARNQLLSGVSRLAAVPVPDGTDVGGWRSEGGWLYSPRGPTGHRSDDGECSTCGSTCRPTR
jgi:hypothetical protein